MLSNETIQSFIFCKYKTYLILNGEKGNESDYAQAQGRLYDTFKRTFIEKVKRSYPECQITYLTFPIDKKLRQHSSIIINPEVQGDDFLIGFDAIETLNATKPHCKPRYAPTIISASERISKNDKLLLTAKTLLLYRVSGQLPHVGKIIYGRDLKSVSVRINDHKKKAQDLLDEIIKLVQDNQKPLIFRNDNCRTCEFEKKCYDYLLEKDDLSLLGGFGLKEIVKRNKKGIFTINQLSYNFRPRRFRKIREKGRPFSHELKALAIRGKKTYIVAFEGFDISHKTEIYIDFEGLPDEDFIYLIGIIVRINDKEKKLSLWADSKENEKRIFRQLLETIKQYDDYVIYHYGSYEIKEFKRIAKSYPHLEKSITSKILNSAINLLSYFYSSIYIPTYTNELKDIAGFLGFRWSAENAKGIQSIAWRKLWELTSDNKYKDTLLGYNTEDCQALIVINEWLKKLAKGVDSEEMYQVSNVADIREQNTYKFGNTKYLLSDFEAINNCAYYDYQREKVFLKTNPKIKRIVQNKIKRHEHPKVRINKRIKIVFPDKCPYCGKSSFYRHDKRKRVIVDLRFSEKGMKRWVTHYDTGRFRCRSCWRVFTPDNFKNLNNRYGRGVFAWAMNQHIGYVISFRNIEYMLLEYFNISITTGYLNRLQSKFALEYSETYRQLLDSITKGHLLHVDETQVKIRDAPSGYVWAFANMDTVCYIFRPNREADFLKELLKEFRGVLISDFYGGYDSIDCSQQKCLIHLIRDLNDDLSQNPFDVEFKQIASHFGQVLRPIIETIEKYGLKRRYLHKHHKSVNRFFRELSRSEYSSELAAQYQKRIKKNKDMLFTFMNYDEIPWNNNNAEHAIKGFAVHRKNVNGLFSKKSIGEFLILLSIYQTCKYRGLNFFQFVLSGKKSFLVYLDKYYRLRKLGSDPVIY
jgi:predicted RecB family nuclease